MSKSPSLRRIQADIRELALDPSDRYYASPLENDMFEWHFTIRGADNTDFEGGVYHGRILLPPEYPLKPPHIMFLTPSGRFETNTKVCLSFSAYHPELWQPAWGIRLILEALISFLPTPADGAIGALDWSSKERKRLATLSQTYCCPTCCKPGSTNNLTGKSIKYCKDLLPELKPKQNKEGKTDVDQDDDSKVIKSKAQLRFAKEIAKLQQLQLENEGPHKSKNEKEDGDGGSTDDSGGKNKDTPSETTPPTTTPTKKSTSSSPSTPTDILQDEMDRVESVQELDVLSDRQPTATPRLDETAKQQEQDKSKKTDENEDTSKTKDTVHAQEEEEEEEASEAPVVIPPVGENAGTAPVADLQEQPFANNVNGNDDPVSWLYDPLLNLMMILLASICYLLLQKYYDLEEELRDLREQQQGY